MRTVTCTQCGWVHIGYTREQAEQEVAKFNAYYDSQPNSTREGWLPWTEQQKPEMERDYALGRSSLTIYEKCWCGSQSFRPAKSGDCPDGCTIGPIIAELLP